MLALHSEAIQSMRQNPGLPELFRDIFKNAYLPYRDPKTLKSFLKEINTFTYDHSERLGDAFEYLLSVLGSQGDAGQFRTPERSNADYWGGDIPWIKTGQIDFNVIQSAEEFITPAGLANSAARMFPAGTILMAMYGQGVTRGRVAILGIDASTNQACAAIEVTSADIDRDYLYWSLAGKYAELRAMSESRGGNQSNLNAQLIREVQIPLPDLATQRSIVAEIEAEQALVAANRELIRRMEAKIKVAIDRVWEKGF